MREMRVIGGKDHRLWPLFANESLRRMAVIWLSIFSSVFVYRSFLPLVGPRPALVYVFFFWTSFGLGHFLGDCLAENLSLKWGLKTQLELGIGILILAFGLFTLSSGSLILLFPAGVIWGLSSGVYWFGWHGEVGKLSLDGRFGRGYGTAELFNGIVNFLAPFLGGILIAWWGYRTLFVAGFGLLFLSLLSLWPLSGKKTHRDATLKEVIKLFATHKKMFLTYFSLGVLGTIGASSFVLYLALILEKELALGEFFSASLVLVGVIKWFIGRLIDLGKEQRFIVWGSLGRAGVWLGRLMTKNIPLLLGLNVVNDLVVGMVGMPLGVLTLKKGVDSQIMGRALLFREAAIGLGHLVAGLVLAVLAWLGLPLTAGFVLAVPLSLVPILIYGKNK